MPYNKSQREELLLAHNAQLSCETPSLRILLVTKIDIVSGGRKLHWGIWKTKITSGPVNLRTTTGWGSGEQSGEVPLPAVRTRILVSMNLLCESAQTLNSFCQKVLKERPCCSITDRAWVNSSSELLRTPILWASCLPRWSFFKGPVSFDGS